MRKKVPRIKLTCDNPDCNNVFFRRDAEVKRSREKGMKTYCSLKCSGAMHKKYLPKGRKSIYLPNGRKPDAGKN